MFIFLKERKNKTEKLIRYIQKTKKLYISGKKNLKTPTWLHNLPPMAGENSWDLEYHQSGNYIDLYRSIDRWLLFQRGGTVQRRLEYHPDGIYIDV